MRKLDDPAQYADGFTLDLYCDHENEKHGWTEFPKQYLGTSFTDCARQAKEDGWIIRRKTRTATCPICSGRRK